MYRLCDLFALALHCFLCTPLVCFSAPVEGSVVLDTSESIFTGSEEQTNGMHKKQWIANRPARSMAFEHQPHLIIYLVWIGEAGKTAAPAHTWDVKTFVSS